VSDGLRANSTCVTGGCLVTAIDRHATALVTDALTSGVLLTVAALGIEAAILASLLPTARAIAHEPWRTRLPILAELALVKLTVAKTVLVHAVVRLCSGLAAVLSSRHRPWLAAAVVSPGPLLEPTQLLIAWLLHCLPALPLTAESAVLTEHCLGHRGNLAPACARHRLTLARLTQARLTQARLTEARLTEARLTRWRLHRGRPRLRLRLRELCLLELRLPLLSLT